MDRVPEVRVFGTALSGVSIFVPEELLGEPPPVVEAQLARQIVRMARPRLHRPRFVSSVVNVLAVGVVAALFQDGLVRAAGVDDVTSPGFVPMVAIVFIVASYLSSIAIGPWRRRIQEREVWDVLDLTRDPDGFVDLLRRDVRGFHANPEPGGLSTAASLIGLDVRLSVPNALRVVERWRASRRVCLLFTDVVGSTVNLNRLGDEGWYEVLCEHDEIVRTRSVEFGGVEIGNAGDGFLILFEDTGQAVLAAIEMQRQLSEIHVAPGEPLRVRMGLHVGDVIRRGQEIAGREVHLAARVGAAATAGEILLSSDAHHELESVGRFHFGPERTIEAKGFEGDHTVHPVIWHADAGVHSPQRAMS